MQIYWNKRKRLHKKRVQLPQDWFGTPTWPPGRHVKTLYNSQFSCYPIIVFFSDYHDLCLQRRRDSLEKQHQEAEDFLEKMREKKMKDLELWKQKHQRMRERHLQQVSIVLKVDFHCRAILTCVRT